MSKNGKIGFGIWIIGFALSVLLLFGIPEKPSDGTYLTLAFDIVAFVSSLIFWGILIKPGKVPKEEFYVSPALTMSAVYLVIQFIICAVEALLIGTISFRATLLLNVITMAVMWILILSTIIAKNHAHRVDFRQKDHHVEL